MNGIKYNLLKFLVSKAGGILAPLIAGLVATVAAKLAAIDPALAGQVDQTSIAAFIVALVISLINYWTNSVQTDGVKQLQALVNTVVDGVPGPLTYTEVRKAIAVPTTKSKKNR